MYIMYANGCVSVDTLPMKGFSQQYNNFHNKYFWEWSYDAADIIFTIE